MTVMVTRRTVRRTHLFRPDPRMSNLFVYCLAVLAARHGIRVHAAVLMSTHEHIVLTDTRGTLPRFLQELHRMLALGVKVLRKWEGAVWDHQKTSVVELRTHQAIVEKLAYVMANPVAAGLVGRAREWPGVTTLPKDLGRAHWTAQRPDFFFDERNPGWPPIAALQLTIPETSATAQELYAEVEAELAALEREAKVELMQRRATVLGARRIRALSPFRRATSAEPLRERNPTFAVGRHCGEAFREAVALLRAFRAAYREALRAWRNGVRRVVFPAGTYLMAIAHGVRVAPAS